MEIVPYVLMDAVRLNRENPRTFDRPSDADIAALDVGQHAKIGVEFDPAVKVGDTVPEARKAWDGIVGEGQAARIGGERFWVLITVVRHPDGGGVSFEGVVDNDLAYTANHGLSYKQVVAFEGRHVLQTN